jgi:hypothetical protein
MAINYQSPLESLPGDGVTVWIRAYNQYSEPVQAVFHLGTMVFTTVLTSVVIPVYFVSRWKSI